MFKSRRFLTMLLAFAVLSSMFIGAGARTTGAADNLWYVTTNVWNARCLLDANGNPRVQWEYKLDYSVNQRTTANVNDTLNGVSTFAGTIIFPAPAMGVQGSLPNSPVWMNATKFPIVYTESMSLNNGAGHITSVSHFTIACRAPGAAFVSLSYDKNTW